MPLPGQRRYKPRNPFNSAALGVYKGAPRKVEPPKMTPYRLTLLRAVGAGEVKRGQGQYAGAWRWHDKHGASFTVTKWIGPMVACGWVKEVGKHAELTDEGRAQLAPTEGETPP